jgi:hypothetical protein
MNLRNSGNQYGAVAQSLHWHPHPSGKGGSAADLRNAVQVAEKGGKRTVPIRVRSGTTARYVTLPVGPR